MAKAKLYSFRFHDDVIKDLDVLAQVYTNGNRTAALEVLIHRAVFWDCIARTGKYPSEFSADASTRKVARQLVEYFFGR